MWVTPSLQVLWHFRGFSTSLHLIPNHFHSDHLLFLSCSIFHVLTLYLHPRQRSRITFKCLLNAPALTFPGLFKLTALKTFKNRSRTEVGDDCERCGLRRLLWMGGAGAALMLAEKSQGGGSQTHQQEKGRDWVRVRANHKMARAITEVSLILWSPWGRGINEDAGG